MIHSVWIKELRAPFLLLPAIFVPVGLAMAWNAGSFTLQTAVLTLVGVLSLHASVNVLNDYFDFRSGIDLATTPTPFSGGSTVLPAKELTPTSVLYAGVAFLATGLGIGSYFLYSFSFNPVLIAIIAIAAVSVVGYSPLISRFGMGELIAGLNFGPLLLLGTYYLETRTVAVEPILVGIALGILVAGILYINEFPDATADSDSGRRHLVVRWGKAKAASRFRILIVSAYLVIVAGVIAGLVTPFAILSLLAFPKAWSATKILGQNYEKTMELIPGMAATVVATLLTGALLFVAYAALRFI
ncbi:MAG TPA: prenyltransferase [Nitrososphaerales archaeon]|nr:prenyltransferase [Nitrososphaerales archaeon]